MFNELEQQTTLPIISEGDTGEDVIILQSELKDLKYYFNSITGSFDDYTKQVLTKFQSAYNLPGNGTMNNETWILLNNLNNNYEPLAILASQPVLRLGSTGPYVNELQTILATLLYYSGAIDGNFGPNTENAVKRFQTNNRLTPDGVVGRDTWGALESLYSPLTICDEDNDQNYITYTIVAGDTLWGLAQRFNTTVDAIKTLNNLTSDTIFVGQQLLIPISNGSTNPPNNFIYTVVNGDTLWRIAQRFNTTVDAIKKLNNLTNDNLSIGQQLLIPTNNQTTITYTVVAGDSLWLLAQRFNTNIDAIKKLNNLTTNNLSIGQQLLIPINS